jgi:hypothetical protein
MPALSPCSPTSRVAPRLAFAAALALAAGAVASSCAPRADCGPHGKLVGNVCTCDEGFSAQSGACTAITAPDAGPGTPDAGPASPDAGVEEEEDPCAPHGELGDYGCECEPQWIGTSESCIPDDDDGCGALGTLLEVGGTNPFEMCNCNAGAFEDHFACSPAPACRGAEDAKEPNDAPATATPWVRGTGSVTAYSCSGNQDWYRFTLAAGETLTVTVSFDHADGAGDLDLLFYSAGVQDVLTQGLLDVSAEEADTERIVYTAPEGGDFLLNVIGYRESEAAYTVAASFGQP